MRINREITAPAVETEKMICNFCGLEIKKNEFGYFDEHLSVEKKWGYGSEFDSETHSFEICEDCYKRLIAEFRIKPLVG
ncbi:MAG: hypothetical protein LBS21_07505 [Clostridiales bacterium]|jgi:hypothetical protein|nr:hypothetical protein [Clostridiales bacterium]